MVFSSASFLFVFLPVVFLLHLVIPNIKVRNFLLVVASLLFYAWGEGLYVLLMIASIFINWIAGLLIAKKQNIAKLVVAISVIINIGMLFAYKYIGFFAELLNIVPFIDIPPVNIHLPLGISFFTFQALSYVIDVYRKPDCVSKSFFTALLYISFFPQLIAGPIVKYHDVNIQINSRQITAYGVATGIRRFIIGMSKKLLIADVLATVADSVFSVSPDSLTGACAWLGAILYTLQIYFDFSGYSDMAIGLGRMFGFNFKENFNYPYISLGIQDFWRRWHISLSTWFKEYLYIPLGGNRKGVVRTYINLFIVFLATGLWHGANLTFVVWGLYNGILMVLERSKFIKLRIKWLSHIYAVFAVIIGFVIFRADSISYAFGYLCRMFSFDALTSGAYDALAYLNPHLILTIIVGVVCSFPIVPAIKHRLISGAMSYKIFHTATYPLCLCLLTLCMMMIASDTYSPFIYFRF